jgi:hypothetical protein
MRTLFLVGRLTPLSAEIVMVDDAVRPPFPGPWVLRAVVRSAQSGQSPRPTPSADGELVH